MRHNHCRSFARQPTGRDGRRNQNKTVLGKNCVDQSKPSNNAHISEELRPILKFRPKVVSTVLVRSLLPVPAGYIYHVKGCSRTN
jgi:hypothetical protein